jgi:hypothetical protein
VTKKFTGFLRQVLVSHKQFENDSHQKNSVIAFIGNVTETFLTQEAQMVPTVTIFVREFLVYEE